MLRFYNDIFQADLRTNEIEQMFSRGSPKQDIHVCHTEIRINDKDAMPPVSKRDG